MVVGAKGKRLTYRAAGRSRPADGEEQAGRRGAEFTDSATRAPAPLNRQKILAPFQCLTLDLTVSETIV
jgi:hypothetical protein